VCARGKVRGVDARVTAKDALADIQEKHRDIKKLERSIGIFPARIMFAALLVPRVATLFSHAAHKVKLDLTSSLIFLHQLN
jgi:hypothetical protein